MEDSELLVSYPYHTVTLLMPSNANLMGMNGEMAPVLSGKENSLTLLIEDIRT